MVHYTLIFGLALSAAYAAWGLRGGAGRAPRLRPTLWPLLHRGMVIVPLSPTVALHVHHWVLYLPVLAWAAARAHGVMAGFALGMVAQGLHYHDRFHFLCPNPYRTDTYAAAPSRSTSQIE